MWVEGLVSGIVVQIINYPPIAPPTYALPLKQKNQFYPEYTSLFCFAYHQEKRHKRLLFHKREIGFHSIVLPVVASMWVNGLVSGI